ncbi:MAG: hypothetical protein ABIP53_11080 [Candidatus Limnocylindrales bacterium]
MPNQPFIAYAVDCVLSGFLELPEGVRLTDFLNETETIALTEVHATSLQDGRVVEAYNLEVDVEELCAVEAPPALSEVGRRIATRVARAEVELDPYEALGHVHGPTSGDPLLALSRRKRMIPLTDVTLAFAVAGKQHIIDLDVLIINRELARFVPAAKYVKSKIDEMGLASPDTRAKDLTGAIIFGHENTRQRRARR